MQPTIDVFNPFERFEIESVLKTLPNGRSNCWKGRTREDDRLVVLKLYDGAISDADKQYWPKLDVPGMAKWRDIYPEEQSVFCVRDWIEGISLYEAVDRRAQLPDEQQTRFFFARVCDALAELHKAEKAHGSIKGTNIFIVDGAPLLTDPVVATPAPPPPGATIDVTQSVAGILHYVNPEILQNKPQTPGSDIYSLGCVLYEWLTGFAPFRGDNDVLVCYQHLSTDPVPVRQLRPDISESLAATVMKMLKKHPVERFSDAAVAATALRDGLEGEPALVIELQSEKKKKVTATRLPSARTTIISAADLKCAQEIMRQSPGLTVDEVRARILAAQGDPLERQRIPVIPFNANQSKALKDLAGPRKPAASALEDTDIVSVDPEVLQRALAATSRAPATVPIDSQALQRAIAATPRPAATTPIDPQALQRAIESSSEVPLPPSDRFKTPFYVVLAYAVLVTILLGWLLISQK